MSYYTALNLFFNFKPKVTLDYITHPMDYTLQQNHGQTHCGEQSQCSQVSIQINNQSMWCPVNGQCFSNNSGKNLPHNPLSLPHPAETPLPLPPGLSLFHSLSTLVQNSTPFKGKDNKPCHLLSLSLHYLFSSHR